MIKTIAALTFGVLVLTGPALAAETEGVVGNYNTNTRMLTLETGMTYVLVDDVEPGDLGAGTKVSVTHEDGSTDATAVTIID